MIFISKTKIKSYKSSKNILKRFIYIFLKVNHTILNRSIRIITDSNYRNTFFLKLFKHDSIHQTTTYTSLDRYPDIFNATRECYKDAPNIKILSYGCSTGEELITLKEYFPTATIVGADVNKYCLKQAGIKTGNFNPILIYSNEYNIKSHGPYDIIFCMAVLQRTPHMVSDSKMNNIKHLYPFEKFNNQLEKLDTNLKQNGLLVVANSQYLFSSSNIASKYHIYSTVTHYQNTPIFDKNSDIIPNINYYHAIYKKAT